MKRRLLKLIALSSLLGVAGVGAREIRTPIQYLQPGYLYYPIQWTKPCESDGFWCFNWQAFGGAFTRDAQDAFGPCDSTCKEPWSRLIFGRSSFALGDVFPGSGSAAGLNLTSNPLAILTDLSPHFEYNEKSAVFGAEVDTCFEVCDSCCLGGCFAGEYRLRLRARLPVRDIVVQDVCGISSEEGLQLEDVYRTRSEVIGDNTAGNPQVENEVYAIRLDFLSLLNEVALPEQKLFNYHNTALGDHVTIASQEVDTVPADDIQGLPPVALLSSPTGVIPVDQRWGDRVVPTTNPDGTPTQGISAVLTADGGGFSAPARAQFSENIDYTPLSTNLAAQRSLFVVPTLTGGFFLNNQLTGAALIVFNAIQNSVDAALPGFQDFLTDTGLNFCDGRTKGLGDLDLDVYLGRNWGCDNQFWTELGFGVRFPTSKKLCDCRELLKQPLGNNGHFEVRGEFLGGWDACETVKFMADFTISKVLKHRENVAAPFVGATVRNIGPCIRANVDWWYLMAHIDATFFACDWCGFDLGYEIYHKDNDKIRLCQNEAVPFLVVPTEDAPGLFPLNGCLLEQGTKVTSNKVRVGFFSNTDTCEVFGGWSYVFAGKNAPRETDFYFNFAVRF